MPAARWYRQFWPWFLIAFPAASVVGGIAVLVIALRSADSVVRDDWYERGLAVNRDLGRDRVARARGIAARVTFDGVRGELRLALTGGDTGRETTLDLVLQHPTHVERDRTFTLVRDAPGRYRAAVRENLRGRWYAAVGPRDGAWRLAEPVELEPGREVALGPAA